LDYELRLKTGFFETKIYAMKINKGKLRLSPQKSADEEIVFLEKDISGIMLKMEKPWKLKSICSNSLIKEQSQAKQSMKTC